MDCNPFAEFSKEVENALLIAGWKPGVNRAMNAYHCSRNKAAESVLLALGGLFVPPLLQAGKFKPLSVNFDPGIAKGYEKEIQELGAHLNCILNPIADVGSGVAIMLMADTGEVLLLGYEERGVLICGVSFAEALDNILTGKEARPIWIEDDPRGLFLNEEIDYNSPTVFRPGNEGLRNLTGENIGGS